MPSKIKKLQFYIFGILILPSSLIARNNLAFNPNVQQSPQQINLPQITTQSVYDVLNLLTVNLVKALQRFNTPSTASSPLINPNQTSPQFPLPLPQIFNTIGRGDLSNNLGSLASSIFQVIFNLIRTFVGAVWTNASQNR